MKGKTAEALNSKGGRIHAQVGDTQGLHTLTVRKQPKHLIRKENKACTNGRTYSSVIENSNAMRALRTNISHQWLDRACVCNRR